MSETKVIVNSVKADPKPIHRKAAEESEFESCTTLDKTEGGYLDSKNHSHMKTM